MRIIEAIKSALRIKRKDYPAFSTTALMIQNEVSKMGFPGLKVVEPRYGEIFLIGDPPSPSRCGIAQTKQDMLEFILLLAKMRLGLIDMFRTGDNANRN